MVKIVVLWYYVDMQKYLRIINIDGTEGSGKTTQIHLLKPFLTSFGVDVRIHHLIDNIQSGIDMSKETLEYLQSNEYGLVINDGSVARMMVTDLVDSMPTNDVIEKYRELIFIQDSLYHQFGTANILLVMNDVKEAHRRMVQKQKMMGKEPEGAFDLSREEKIVQMMRLFDNHVVSRNTKFETIDVEPETPMLGTLEAIKKYLKDNFEIKKPS